MSFRYGRASLTSMLLLNFLGRYLFIFFYELNFFMNWVFLLTYLVKNKSINFLKIYSKLNQKYLTSLWCRIFLYENMPCLFICSRHFWNSQVMFKSFLHLILRTSCSIYSYISPPPRYCKWDLLSSTFILLSIFYCIFLYAIDSYISIWSLDTFNGSSSFVIDS